MSADTNNYPRSVVRHRPIGTKSHQGVIQLRTHAVSSGNTNMMSASSPYAADVVEHPDGDGAVGEQRGITERLHSVDPVTRPDRLAPIVGRRRVTGKVTQTSHKMSLNIRNKPPMFWIVSTLACFFVGWFLLVHVWGWWIGTSDDWTYSTVRTTHFSAVVGHQDNLQHPSQFIATNLRGQIAIIEMRGGDPAKIATYQGPNLVALNWAQPDKASVILSLQPNVRTGKDDLVVTIQSGVIGANFQRVIVVSVVLANTGQQFQPLK